MIDLVYLWVDGNDPQWKARRNALIGNTSPDSAVNCEGRYIDNQELRFSLRSVAEYAPWINRIFIVTDRQTPDWLDTSNPKIRIVDHSEFIPREALPTFNSVVIEHCLWRIPDLSEKFLFANDDMFFSRPVSPQDFFTDEGLPIIRFTRRPCRKLTLWLKEHILHKQISNYNLTISTAARMVEKRLGRYVGHKPHHNIDAYCKSYLEHVYRDLFHDEIEPTLTHHVRSDGDIQRSIYSYAAVAERKGKVEFVDRHTSFHFHIDNHSHYAKLEKARPMLFCMNDSQYATDDDRRLVADFLRRRFPEPSPFERRNQKK